MQPNAKHTLAKQRHWARRLALQALYQWQLSGNDIASIEQQFVQDDNYEKADGEYFKELLKNIPLMQVEIDQAWHPYLDRNITELDPVELAIVRIGSYELLKRIDVPYRVVLNEALELAKNFGATDGHKFVNGILDKVAHRYRRAEIAH